MKWGIELPFGFGIDTIYIVPAVILALSFHELSHGFISYKLGDLTAKSQGRITMNPMKHIDIIGLFMLIHFGFGWAKPVSVDVRYFKNPKTGMALTALAGPLSNFILAYFAMFIWSLLLPINNNDIIGILSKFLIILAQINVGLAIFNLLPFPPLDGSKILMAFLPDDQYYTILQYERYGMIILVIVLISGFFDPLLFFLRSFAMDFLIKIASGPVIWLYDIIL